MSEASLESNKHRQAHAVIHAGVVEQLQDYGHLVKVIDEEPGMTGNFLRPPAVVFDDDRSCLQAGIDVFRPALALG